MEDMSRQMLDVEMRSRDVYLAMLVRQVQLKEKIFLRVCTIAV
jgi:hypothetical protein